MFRIGHGFNVNMKGKILLEQQRTEVRINQNQIMQTKILSGNEPCECSVRNQYFRDLLHIVHQE
jgi:hypothetical protein